MTDAVCGRSWPAAVLFDFDGTLAELTLDFDLMRRLVCALLTEHHVPSESQRSRYVLELIDEGAAYVAAHQGDAAAVRRACFRALGDLECRAANKARLVPGAKATLNWLERIGLPYGIVTRNCRAAVEIVLECADLCCPVVLTRDDVPSVKPDPAHFAAALNRLDRPPRESLMVGDHPMDVETGSALGMVGIGVLTGASTNDQLNAAGAWQVLPSVAALPAVLETTTFRPEAPLATSLK